MNKSDTFAIQLYQLMFQSKIIGDEKSTKIISNPICRMNYYCAIRITCDFYGRIKITFILETNRID